MWRRSVLELSSRQSVRRTPTQGLPQVWQISQRVSTRKEFSSAPKQSLKPQPTSEPPKSGSLITKVVVGSVAIGGTVFAAYQFGYLDQLTGGKEHNSSFKSTEAVTQKSNSDHLQPLVVQKLDSSSRKESENVNSNREVTEKLNPSSESTDQKVETDAPLSHPEALGEGRGDTQFQREDTPSIIPDENTKEKELPEFRQSSRELEDKKVESIMAPDLYLNIQGTETNTGAGPHEGVQTTPMFTPKDPAPKQVEARTQSQEDVIPEDKLKDANAIAEGIDQPSPLLEAYHLKDGADAIPLGSPGKDEIKKSLNETEVLISEFEDLSDGYISKDGKLVVDFLQAIHAAEKRQAELDSRVFADEKRALKEKLEKELRDARVRELMHAEEAAILEKELKRERAKSAAALTSLQEKLEEKFQKELEQKENEGESKLTKFQDMAKAELAAAIAREKASQIEQMAEANLHINALCMAFYARSEEARQSHSAQKLALGALALEDALSRGLPIQAEIEALRSDLQGIDKDSNLELVLSSIPEEIINHGSDSLLQINEKFDALKTTLRHFSLIPPGGGGILTHSLARIASLIKVREVEESGHGIESIISRVESYLAEGNLAEAAQSLEEGVKGTKAADIVGDWVRQARNRAITEQALTLLQLYASSINLT